MHVCVRDRHRDREPQASRESPGLKVSVELIVVIEWASFQSYPSPGPGPGPPAWAGISGATQLELKPSLGSREIEIKQRSVLEWCQIAALILVSPQCWHGGLNSDCSSKDGAGAGPSTFPRMGKW